MQYDYLIAARQAEIEARLARSFPGSRRPRRSRRPVRVAVGMRLIGVGLRLVDTGGARPDLLPS